MGKGRQVQRYGTTTYVFLIEFEMKVQSKLDDPSADLPTLWQ